MNRIPLNYYVNQYINGKINLENFNGFGRSSNDL